jgi:tetratricopeptide (TPR) repeat protein
MITEMGQRCLLFFMILLVAKPLAAQRFMPDSIAQRFAHEPQDSAYVSRLNEIASSYLRTNPEITRSIASHLLDIAPRINYTQGYARSLTVMGNSYWYEGIYEFAQNYYLLAARQYQSINDSIGLGQTYNNIGEVYKKLNEYDKALQYLTKAAELKEKDIATRGITLYNIGELHIQVGNIEKGKRYVQEALEVARQQNNPRVIAFCYWSFGSISRKEKDYQIALQYYFDAEKIWRNLNEIRSLVKTYQDIAEIYSEQKKYTDAETYLSLAMQLAREIRVPDLQVNNYLRFSKLDSLRGNYARALYFLSRHNSLKDSVYNLLKAEQIARLQTIYETETRERENRQLRDEKQLKDSQLRSQQLTLTAISVGLLLSGVLTWFLYRQRKKIMLQKNAIEIQATALQKLNSELLELNKNLEARIDERTFQLTLQNQRLAEYTFISAHKLRAPVASILGLINLAHQVEPEEQADILEHLKTCTEQLDTIIWEMSRNLEGAIVKETKA